MSRLRAWPPWRSAALGAAGLVVAAGWLWVNGEPPAGDQKASTGAKMDLRREPVVLQPMAQPTALGVAGEVAASSPAPRRPTPGWTKLTLETPLADLLAAAQASGDTYDLLVAVRLMSACTSARNATESHLAAINEMRLSAMAPEHVASAAARQSGDSHRAMLRYCAALDDPAVAAWAQAVRQREEAAPSAWRTLAGQPAKSRGETWPQDQYQAALLTLTDPAAQAVTLEAVLRMLPPTAAPGRAGLNTFQADVVRVLVAQELTGDRNPRSMANTAACMQRAVCDVGSAAFAADPTNRAVRAAAEHGVQLIRTQQWAAIGLVPR